MTPEELDEATVEEAKRRWLSTPALRIHGTLGGDVPFIAARLARENWTPPEPAVDPDVLAFRRFASTEVVSRSLADAYRSGELDNGSSARMFFAGARMAREQERERANMPIGMAGALVDRCQRLLHSLPAGVHDQLDVKWGLDALCRAIEAEIAKYRGEA